MKHPYKPEWGPGEVENITDTTVHIFFRNDPEKKTRMFSRISQNGPIEWESYKEDIPKKRDDLNNIHEKPESEIHVEVTENCLNYLTHLENIYPVKTMEESSPPSSPGIYAWYFDEPPPYVPTSGCTFVKAGGWLFKTKWWLLYIGRAEDLNDRNVNYHIKGEHYAEGTISSLRLSLGCLLSKKLDLILYYPPESFGAYGDSKLNEWLKEHVRISWIEVKNIYVIEPEIIRNCTLPLNYKDNDHPLKKPLSNLRTAFRNISKNLGQKSNKKEFRRAYENFARECKSLGINR